jgi:hypothetical protein
MQVTWKVLWTKPEGGRTFRKFSDPEDSSPKAAVAFGKELKRQGIKPSIISANKAWRPTAAQEANRRPGDLWCPYCIKWRRFKLFAIRRKNYVTEAFLRCPVCTVSTNDFWVKRYNNMLEHMSESELMRRLAKDDG